MMNFTWSEVELSDLAENIMWNGTNLTELYWNGTMVWKRETPPSAIADFAIAPTPCEYFTNTWSTPAGDLPMTFDIFWADGTLANGNVTSPFVSTCAGGNTVDRYVRAYNNRGTSDSNIASATCVSCCVPGSIVFDVAGSHTWTSPVAVNAINISLMGAGGGGSSKNDETGPNGCAGGGHSGGLVEKNGFVIAPEAVHSLYIGFGGVPGGDGNGSKGEDSAFHTELAIGGAGGVLSDSCGSTHYQGSGWINGWGYQDGLVGSSEGGTPWGGQASAMGNGGSGTGWGTPGVAGGVGGGGGGYIAESDFAYAGPGGRGELWISWYCSLGRKATETLYVSKMTDKELKKYGIKLHVDKED